MNAERGNIRFGEHRIEFIVHRRDRKTLEIAVEPDTSVVVVAPLAATPEAINEKMRKRAAWILRQQGFFHQYLPRTPRRQFIAGETHLYLGRQYRLKVVPHVQAGVKLTRGFIWVQSHRPGNNAITRDLVTGWYSDRAHVKFRERLEINLNRFPNPETFRPHGIIIRQLRQRWGGTWGRTFSGSKAKGGELATSKKCSKRNRREFFYHLAQAFKMSGAWSLGTSDQRHSAALSVWFSRDVTSFTPVLAVLPPYSLPDGGFGRTPPVMPSTAFAPDTDCRARTG